MSITYAIAFGILTLVIACVATLVWSHSILGAAVLAYGAISLLMLTLCYAGFGPWLMGKQPTGTRTWLARVCFAPLGLLNHFVLTFYRTISREPAYVQFTPTLWLGRHLHASECHTIPWQAVLDVAPELEEAAPLRALPGYCSLPVLDGTAPSSPLLQSAVDWLVSATAQGPVYVHCALGHSRSACIVVAYLLHTGLVRTVREGENQLKSLRPGVCLNAAQRKRLKEFSPPPTELPTPHRVRR